MTILNILKYPDQRLYKVAREVKVVNKEIKTLISNMAETMYKAPGIGLAATQVDFHQRIIIIDISEDKNNLLVLINPILLESKGEELNQEELDDVAGTMIRDDIKGIEPIESTGNSLLYSKNLAGLHVGDFIHLEITSFTTD